MPPGNGFASRITAFRPALRSPMPGPRTLRWFTDYADRRRFFARLWAACQDSVYLPEKSGLNRCGGTQFCPDVSDTLPGMPDKLEEAA